MEKTLEQTWKETIKEHPVESKKSALQVTMAIQDSELNAGNRNYTRTLHMPKFFTKKDKENFEHITNVMMEIFHKAIEAYKTDPEVRALFPFDERLNELISLPAQYETPIPICRIDIFYDEKTGDFKFCEFNTDGTSAMNENARLNGFLELNNVYGRLDKPGTYMELMDSWIDAFLENTGMEKPVIAITDFLENAYLSELYVFERMMKERGLEAEVIDIRDFDYKDGKLVSKKTGRQFDAVYRRAVTGDVMKGYDEIQPFIQAVKDGAVILEGPFSTNIPHHKAIAMALHDPALRKHLSEEEIAFIDAHQPKTWRLTKEKAEEILKTDKDKWIIKPIDSYAAKGVFAGKDLNHKEWEEVVRDFAGKDHIVQEYATPYRSENIDLVEHDDFRDYTNLTGLYVYNGKFAGVYSRMSEDAIVSTQYNEKTVPTLFVD